MDEEPCELDVFVDELFDEFEGYGSECRGLESECARHVWLVGEIGTVAEVLHRSDETYDLHAAADAFLGFLHLAFEQTPEVFRFFAFGVDELVFLESVYMKILGHGAALVGRKYRPYFGHVFIDHFPKGVFYHRVKNAKGGLALAGCRTIMLFDSKVTYFYIAVQIIIYFSGIFVDKTSKNRPFYRLLSAVGRF